MIIKTVTLIKVGFLGSQVSWAWTIWRHLNAGMAVCLGRMTESNERLAVWCRRLGQDSRTAPPFSVCLCSFVLPRMIYEWNYTALAFWIRLLSLIIIHMRFILKVVWIPGSFLLIAGECFFVWIYQGVFIYWFKNIWIFQCGAIMKKCIERFLCQH